MKRLLTDYTILTLLLLATLGALVFYTPSAHPAILSLPLFIWWWLNSVLFASTKMLRKFPFATLWGALAVFTLIVCIQSPIYFFYQINATTITITLTCISLLALFVERCMKHSLVEHVQNLYRPTIEHLWRSIRRIDIESASRIVHAILIVLGDAYLLHTISRHATTDILASPWLTLGKPFFVTFGITTFLLLFYLVSMRPRTAHWMPLVILHTLTAYLIAALLYPLGFGYDPLLHRASQSHILEFGAITPKTPFYIGQYVFVTMVSKITGLAIKPIDIFLVPLLSGVFLPPALYTGMRYGIRMSERYAALLCPLLLLFPFQTVYATTPYNLATFLTIITIFLSPLYLRYNKVRPFLWLVAFAAALTHILAGAFAITLLFLVHLRQHKRMFGKALWRLVLGVSFIGTSILIPALFIVYQQLIQKKPFPTLASISERLPHFLSFFKEPYYFTQQSVGFWWELLYTYRPAIIPIIIGLTLFALWKSRVKVFPLFTTMSGALFVSAFLLTTLISFPDLHIYDQLQYSARLLHLSVIFLLLPAFWSIFYITRLLLRSKPNLVTAVCVTLSICVTASLYLTYPQTNPKVYFRGFNVTNADYQVVDYIHEAKQDDYIVLTNIITAGAAIERYGFATYYSTPEGQQLYYSTPSGSPLYKLYLEMIHEGQKRETIETAMDITGTSRAYFVLPAYWDNFETIKNTASSTADTVTSFDGGRVWVFTYDRSDIAAS